MKISVPLVVSVLAYGVALFLPALHGGGSHVDGLVLLVLGWVQLAEGQCVAWLANPMFLIACVAFALRRFRLASAAAVASCLIGLDTFRATVFSLNEAGQDVPIERVGAAFYLWELSFLFLLLASIGGMARGRAHAA